LQGTSWTKDDTQLLGITTSSGTQTSDYTLFQMTTIGRAPGSTIVVDGAHALISLQHATIELRHGHFHALCYDRGTSLAGLCLWIDNMDEITSVHQARFAVSAIPSAPSRP